MDLQTYEKIDALVSVIEDLHLRLHENNAIGAYVAQLERDWGKRFRDSNRERLFFYFKENTIRWKSWLMESTNVYEHNCYFYENRLQEILGKVK